jgi:hypothetical protein
LLTGMLERKKGYDDADPNCPRYIYESGAPHGVSA